MSGSASTAARSARAKRRCINPMMESEGRRVLAMMPHPDDMEILCAGTLIRLRELGWEVHVATMTAGDKGSATLPPEEIARIRRVEAQRGAEVVGATSYRCLEFA